MWYIILLGHKLLIFIHRSIFYKILSQVQNFSLLDLSVQSQIMKSATTNNEETSSVNYLEIAKLCVFGIAFVLAISTLALFADAQRQNDEANRLRGTTKVCLLFVTRSSGGIRVDRLRTSCNVSFASGSVAILCLLIISITSFIKVIMKLNFD